METNNCHPLVCAECSYRGICPIEYGQSIGLSSYHIGEIIDRAWRAAEKHKAEKIKEEKKNGSKIMVMRF
ncbi:hypothetical protein HZB04_01495 [Candidatus Wolfebacteria bacterium]|nr:hypothetical protein [Candidatus Wolfebacteria bacterium]